MASGIARENYIDFKWKAKGYKVWKRKWVVLRQMSDLTTKTFVAKLDLFPDYDSYRANKKKITVVLENGSKNVTVKKIKSKTHDYAFQIISDEPPLYFAGATESDSQGWMKAIRRIFSPPVKTCGEGEYEVAVVETLASARQCMEQDYIMKITNKDILLNSEYDSSTVFTWPLTTLKRFELASLSPNAVDLKKMLHILAGPGCPTGEGEYFFYSEKAEDIFNAIMTAITSSTAPGNQKTGIVSPPEPIRLQQNAAADIDPSLMYDTLDDSIPRTIPKPKTDPLPDIPGKATDLPRRRSVPNILEQMNLPEVPQDDGDLGPPLPDSILQSRETPVCFDVGDEGLTVCQENLYSVPPDRTIVVERSDGYSVIQSLYWSKDTAEELSVVKRKPVHEDAKSHSDSMTSTDSESHDSGVGTTDQRISGEIEKDASESKNDDSDEMSRGLAFNEDPYSRIDEDLQKPNVINLNLEKLTINDKSDSGSAHYSEIGDMSKMEDFYAVPPDRGSDDCYAIPRDGRGFSNTSHMSSLADDERSGSFSNVKVEVTAPDDEENVYEELTDFIENLKSLIDTENHQSDFGELDELLKNQKGTKDLKKMLMKKFGVTEEQLNTLKSSKSETPVSQVETSFGRSMSVSPDSPRAPPAVPKRSISVFDDNTVMRKSGKIFSSKRLTNLFSQKKHDNNKSFDDSDDDPECDKQQLSPNLSKQKHRKSFEESKMNNVSLTKTSPKVKERRRSKSHEGHVPFQVKPEEKVSKSSPESPISPNLSKRKKLKSLFGIKTKKIPGSVQSQATPDFDASPTFNESSSAPDDAPVANLISLDDLDIPSPTQAEPVQFHSLQRPPKKKNPGMTSTPLGTPPITKRNTDLFTFDLLGDSTEVISPVSNLSTPPFGDLASPSSDSDPFDPSWSERNRVPSFPLAVSISPNIERSISVGVTPLSPSGNTNVSTIQRKDSTQNWVTFENDNLLPSTWGNTQSTIIDNEWSSFCNVESRRKASHDSLGGFGSEYLDMGSKQLNVQNDNLSGDYIHPQPSHVGSFVDEPDPNSSSC